jgi:hypothetical protein
MKVLNPVSTGQAKRSGTDDPEPKTWLFLRFILGKSKVLEKRALLGLKTLGMSKQELKPLAITILETDFDDTTAVLTLPEK